MIAPNTDDEALLDAEWRAPFGQPLPIRGCADLVRKVLSEHRAFAAPPAAPPDPVAADSGDGALQAAALAGTG